MKLLKLIIGITLGIGLTLSSAANTADTANIKQRVKIKPFHSINIATVGRVTIKQGPKCTMKISGSKRLMNLTKFNVEDGELSVYFTEGIKNINTRNEQIKIIITTPKLNRIDFSGVGQLTCDSTIRLDNDIYIHSEGVGNIYVDDLHCQSLHIKLEGVGKANINVHCKQNLDAEVNGVGSITLSGYTPSLHTEQNGVGRIKKSRLRVGN